MREIIIAFLFFTCVSAHAASSSKKYQFNLNGGIEQIKAGQTRTAGATWTRFAISNSPKTFRLIGAFSGLVGSSFMQGNFSMGVHLYPFASISRTPILPFIGVEGVFGLGKLLEELRYDIGYDIMSGVDIRFGKSSGLQGMVISHKGAEESLVLMLGIYFQG